MVEPFIYSSSVSSINNTMDRHDESFSPMEKQKSRAQRTLTDPYDSCPALTRVFESEDILLHLSLFVVLPLPYLSKVYAQQGDNSFTSAQIYALSRYDSYFKWKYCKFSESLIFMIELVKRRAFALKLASEELQDDRDFMLEAIKQDGFALYHASAALKDDREFVLEAVKKKGDALFYASAALKDDREIVLEAVKQDGHALSYASAGLRNGGLREYLYHNAGNKDR